VIKINKTIFGRCEIRDFHGGEDLNLSSNSYMLEKYKNMSKCEEK
jgi:hypothetical protein